jgi:hypothetical protein
MSALMMVGPLDGGLLVLAIGKCAPRLVLSIRSMIGILGFALLADLLIHSYIQTGFLIIRPFLLLILAFIQKS